MRFNERKATQAAACLLRHADGSMNHMLLIKLLYLADRVALLEWGRPITRDQYYSMKYGPVLSEVLSLVNGEISQENENYWGEHISPSAGYVVRLLSDPGDDELSEAEEEALLRVYREYGHYDRFALADHLHRVLPEWTPLESGRALIRYRDILTAGGKSAEETAAIEHELASIDKLDCLLGTY